MRLPSHQLEAFHEVAQCSSFSQAAKRLHLSQSAVSQRVLNLEEQLATALFLRDGGGVRLTEAGQALLRFCQTSTSLEQELLHGLTSGQGVGLGGTLRLGGIASVMWSIIIPAIAPLLAAHPEVQVVAMARELNSLPQLLRSGSIDYTVIDYALDLYGVKTQLLGYETNVLVEPAKLAVRPHLFIDHDGDDRITSQFFSRNGLAHSYRRLYMDDVHGIIAGVKAGWGCAILPRHLLANQPELRINEQYPAMRTPVYLAYYEQPYYSRLHSAVEDALVAGCRDLLR